MWISKNIAPKAKAEKAEKGSVTLSSKELEAGATVIRRDIESYGPYGYQAMAPVGESVMIIPSDNGQAVIGSLQGKTDLASGEVRITSKGGATIVLRNDGTIELNSLVIDRDGVILDNE